ncbi:MAG: hypothetical protein IAE79_27905 [Anaerolinea sp.]|nr:hypothetical protein [Anaerolinea sp.]
MKSDKRPTTRQEVFNCLSRLLGSNAYESIMNFVNLHENAQVDQAVGELCKFDATIGGFGLHTIAGRNSLTGIPGVTVDDRDIYRPVQYILAVLNGSNAAFQSRNVVEMACAHVEAVLKRIATSGFLGELVNGRKPMGALLRAKFEKKLPPALYQDLLWLNDSIYIFAKHEYGSRPGKRAEESYFDLDEAVAIYFIARYLVVQLSQ